jgi:hypothetical protein
LGEKGCFPGDALSKVPRTLSGQINFKEPAAAAWLDGFPIKLLVAYTGIG